MEEVEEEAAEADDTEVAVAVGMAKAASGSADARACRAAIEAQLQRVSAGPSGSGSTIGGASQLDYSKWQWFPKGEGVRGGMQAAAAAQWSLTPTAGGDAAAGSAQASSGWHWTDAGWVHSAPAKNSREDCVRDGSDAADAMAMAQRSHKAIKRSDKGSAAEARSALALAPRMKASLRMKARKREARLWSIRGCWWRRLLRC